MAANRALLEQLMGATRNLTAAERAQQKVREVSWKDDDQCKYYICGVCPHDVMAGSKFDLWPCPHKHDDQCRAQFEKEPLAVRMSVERQWVAYVEDRVIRPCDRRVAQGEARVAANNERLPALVGGTAAAAAAAAASSTGAAGVDKEKDDLEKKIAESSAIQEVDSKAAELDKNISVLQMQIDEMKKAAVPKDGAATGTGADGAAATTPTAASGDASASAESLAASALQKLVDGLQGERAELDAKRAELVKSLKPALPAVPTPAPAPAAVPGGLSAALLMQRDLQTCKVCASLIRVDDTEERLRDHREGKLHASFQKLRTKAAEIHEAHQKALREGVVTEAQIRSAMGGGSGAAPPAFDRPRGGFDHRDREHHRDHRESVGGWRGGHTEWRGGGSRDYRGGGGDPRDYRRGDPRDYRDDRRYDRHGGYGGHGAADAAPWGGRGAEPAYQQHRSSSSSSRHHHHHRSSSRRSRSPRSRSRSESRSRSRSRDRSSRSSRHHRSSRRSSRSRSPSKSASPSSSRSPSPSRSRSRSRSRSGSRRKSSKSSGSRRTRSRTRSRSGSRHRSSRKHRSSSRRSRSRSKSRDKKRDKDSKSETKEERSNSTAGVNEEAKTAPAPTPAPAVAEPATSAAPPALEDAAMPAVADS